MVEWKVNHPQNFPGDINVRLPNPSIRKPQTNDPGPSFSNILASIAATKSGGIPRAGRIPHPRGIPQPGGIPPEAGYTITQLTVPHLRPVPEGCSVTSLAMVLLYYGIGPGNYFAISAAEPEQLHDVAEQLFGVRAGLVHNGSLNDLVNLIDHGIPPIIFGTEGGSGHCVVLCGYERDATTGQVTNVYLNDPNRPDGGIMMSSAEFQAFWEGGSDNEYMVLTRPGTPQYDYMSPPQPNSGVGIACVPA